MARRKLKLTFPPELVTAPVVYQLSQDFGLSTTMRRGDISEDHSWVIMEMEGSDEDLDRGLAWVTEKGITVQDLENEAA
jgi:hypothetical protein